MAGFETRGRLIGVVGPSGVGKDSVMAALAATRPDVKLVRRVITRAHDAGGEDYDAVDETAFEAEARRGAFALHWRAHGLRYGVPVCVEADLVAGHVCLVNLSRAVLADAQALFDGFTVLSLTAPKAVLAERLAARGRESATIIETRLNRANFALPGGLLRVVEVPNIGPVEETAARAMSALYPESAKR
ncbi:MAG: phosphonate metabolism protein/1,5-bisphosphokinase (PRPP-forming) PhnN [Pseudomonadota bacterium]